MDRLLICTGRLVPKSKMTWQGLTYEDREELHEKWAFTNELNNEQDVADFVEKLLKEKNEKNCTGHRDEHGSRYDPFVRNSGH